MRGDRRSEILTIIFRVWRGVIKEDNLNVRKCWLID